ncbi:cytochrome P450 CYP749A22-like [Andrographis paniculata]|uniref:cytochrome P450 CYP749A22-like n=1 Tax=Andrographis paniculata TaxID=175694 RepID=UPI0021E7D13D|nr:cytochrome P450 CYP749A22-like [Andrographis paniculata]
MAILLLLLLSLPIICLLLLALGSLKKLWLDVIRVQAAMNSQGVNGPSYRFLHGNTKEIVSMRRESTAKAMDGISHDIFPRIQPHLHTWTRLYGTIFLFWYGSTPELVTTEADLIKEVLTNRDGHYTKLVLQGYSKKLLGDGLSSSEGKKWMKMRKIADSFFNGKSLKSMIPEMVASVETMLEKWKEYEDKEIEVLEEFRILTSEIISRTAFGSSYTEGKNIFDMLMQLTLILTRNHNKIRFPGISRFLPDKDEIESDKLQQGIRDRIFQMIKKKETEQGSRPDFLGKLLEVNRDTEESMKISVEDIVDECKTFYFAGHETLTSLLSWTILLLSVHQEWQERARKEVTELFAGQKPDPEGISRMKIMNLIIQESLRLYPPIPEIKRRVDKQTKLGKLSLIPETKIGISQLAIHHDPKIWGAEAHLFRPERFKEAVVKACNGNAAAFIPFGFGPRICVGLNFATAETKIAVSMILLRYKLIVSTTYIHSPIQAFTIRPQHGIPVILQRIK